MGQNLDKTEGGEQMAREEFVGQDVGFREVDVTERENSCDEETVNNEERLGKPKAQDLGPGQKPRTPSAQNLHNLRVTPSTVDGVKAGGAWAELGGGRTASLASHEMNQNWENRMNSENLWTFMHLDQIQKTTRESKPSADFVMEHQKRSVLYEEDSTRVSGDVSSIPVEGNHDEDFGVMKIKSERATSAFNQLSPSLHQDQRNRLRKTEEREDEDLKKPAGTVHHFRDRKEPVPAKSQHPLKNTVQKEPLLDLSVTIQSKAMTPSTTKARGLISDEDNNLSKEIKYSFNKSIANDPIPTKQALVSVPDEMEEPGSILEKLLKRNKLEATSSLSKIKEVATDNSQALDNVINHYNGAQLSTEQARHTHDTTCKTNHTLSHEKKQGNRHIVKEVNKESENKQVSGYNPPDDDAGTGLLTISEVTIVKKSNDDQQMKRIQPQQSKKSKDDSVIVRDKPQSALRPRPISELIKASIQIHEKLVQQERCKAVELRTDEHEQSAKVAQMKAAFDCAQKSSEKAIERKPSVRKGTQRALRQGTTHPFMLSFTHQYMQRLEARRVKCFVEEHNDLQETESDFTMDVFIGEKID